MTHYQALKQLMPINLGPLSDTDMRVEGALLDAVVPDMLSLLPEFFPSSITTALIAQWEAEYGVIPRAGSGFEDRRRAVLAQYIRIGSLTAAHFTALAAALGYEITITEGGETFVPFRAGISRAGDPVYSAGALWVWTVTTQNKPAAADIRSLFADLGPPHMRLEFAYGGP
jgi:uncharacterized protein YmfQ (DUF2313 family)